MSSFFNSPLLDIIQTGLNTPLAQVQQATSPLTTAQRESKSLYDQLLETSSQPIEIKPIISARDATGTVQSVRDNPHTDAVPTNIDERIRQNLQALETMIDFTPIVGDIKGVTWDPIVAGLQGGFGDGMKMLSAGLIGFVPVVGDAAKTGVKTSLNTVRALKLSKTLNNNIKKANILTPRLRGTTTFFTKISDDNTIYDTHLYDLLTGSDIGQLSVFKKGNDVPYVTNIIGSPNNKKVSEDLYNSFLKHSTSGLLSGKNLLRPEITEKVWNHFPFNIIDNNGLRPNKGIGNIVNLAHPTTIIPEINPSHFIHVNNIPKDYIDSKTLSISGKDIAVYKLLPRYNKWAEFYGYPKISTETPIKDIESLMKKSFEKHNRFYRGLRMPIGEDLDNVKKFLGENASNKDIMNYIASMGRPGDTYASPLSNAGMYGNDVAILRRKFTLGEDPKTWLDDVDFNYTDTPATHTINTGVNYPWATDMDTKIIPNEVRYIPDEFEHVGWMPKNYFDPELGWLVDPDDFDGSLNVYINPIKGIKPKFKQGGKLNENN